VISNRAFRRLRRCWIHIQIDSGPAIPTLSLRSAKGAARTPEPIQEPIAPHSVLREFLRSAKGAARTPKPTQEPIAPHSVLREFLKGSTESGRGSMKVEERAPRLPTGWDAAAAGTR
jgi:hypothetical protein